MTSPGQGQASDCEHVKVHHEHGTIGAYRADHCRCADCTASHRAARRTQVRAQATGAWQPFTPADPVRRHVETLRSAGVGIDRIAQLAGVAGSTVRLLIYGINGHPLEKLNTATASRLLAAKVREADRAERSTVDSTETRALLGDLLAAGIGWNDIATTLGRTVVNLRRSFNRPSVTVKSATDIARLHHQLLAANGGPTARFG